MDSRRSRPQNPLDSIRKERGPGPCRNYFRDRLNSRRPDAEKLINDPALSFATFFTLLPELSSGEPPVSLSPRNREAQSLCRIIREDKSANGNAQHPSYVEGTRHVLRWMFSAGIEEDGLCQDFDRAVDISASILLKIYHDTEILPGVVRLLFLRNRKKACLHDLALAFFQSAGPDTLRETAKYLLSPRKEDVEFAQDLLHLPRTGNSLRDRRARYQEYLNWLDENRPYLAPTGDSFASSARPHACQVDLKAKYLHRGNFPGKKLSGNLPAKTETDCLSCFSRAKEEEKELLARYSCHLCEKDPGRWKEWIRLPLKSQLDSARKREAGQ